MDLTPTLQAYGQVGVALLQEALAEVEATGKTVESVRYVVESTNSKDRLQLLAREFTSLIEKGRGPTNKGPSSDMIAYLTDYARARGMDNPEKAAWTMAKSMNKKGDQTHQKGGRVVYSDDLSKFVEELKAAIAKIYAKQVLAEIKGAFKGGSNN